MHLFDNRRDLHESIVSISVSQSVRGYFVLGVIAAESVTDRVTVSYEFRQMAPKLRQFPARVSATLLRGKQYTFQVRDIKCFTPDISDMLSKYCHSKIKHLSYSRLG